MLRGPHERSSHREGTFAAAAVFCCVSVSLFLSLLLTAWPADDARLTTLALPAQPARKVRVFVDAGHGAPGNEGNHGCACQLKQEHTLKVAQHLAFVLAATGRFAVKLSRMPGEEPLYRPRIAAAEAFKADVIISLHSDARGDATPSFQDAGVCWQNPTEPGFSVLWNDEGPAFPRREKLGRAVGGRLREGAAEASRPGGSPSSWWSRWSSRASAR